MVLLQYLLIAGATLIGFLVVLYLFGRVRSLHVDDAKALHIAAAIRKGAMTFLKEEYKVIAIVVAHCGSFAHVYSWVACCPALYSWAQFYHC